MLCGLRILQIRPLRIPPDWDKLIDEFKGSETTLIADVDCTKNGKKLCAKVGVDGYPTIKYGDPNDLQTYEGGRDLDSLKAFAHENLGPKCGLRHKDLCEGEELAQLDAYLVLSEDDLDAKIAEIEGQIAAAEAEFEVGKAEIEATNTELTTAKEGAITAIGKGYPRLSYLQMVQDDREADKGIADADIP